MGSPYCPSITSFPIRLPPVGWSQRVQDAFSSRASMAPERSVSKRLKAYADVGISSRILNPMIPTNHGDFFNDLLDLTLRILNNDHFVNHLCYMVQTLYTIKFH